MASSYVVVDGSNIATEGRKVPSLRQLDDAVTQFQVEYPDREVIVVVDATFGHRIDPSERATFEAAVEHGELVSPPAGAVGRGDAFLLRVAERVEASVLSNDSFQEFHGEQPWLFDEGRLIGGTPVADVGWIFVARRPVRGPRSRESVKAAAIAPSAGVAKTAKATKATKATKAAKTPKAAKPTKGTKVGEATQAAKAAKAPKATKSAKAAEGTKTDKSPKMTKGTKATKETRAKEVAKAPKAAKSAKAPKAPKAPQAAKAPKAAKAAKAAKTSADGAAAAKARGRAAPAARVPTARRVRNAIEVAIEEALVPGDPIVAGSARATVADARVVPPAGVNDPLTFLTFVSDHPLNSEVEGVVESFTSHGAMVQVDGMRCYVPLAGMADPPPTRAREVLQVGERRRFVLMALDPPRRGAELAVTGVAAPAS